MSTYCQFRLLFPLPRLFLRYRRAGGSEFARLPILAQQIGEERFIRRAAEFLDELERGGDVALRVDRMMSNDFEGALDADAIG